ncbi:protein RGF1 INDUCIBLE TRANSCRIPTION FACTOR 1-like [Impatiens glandulifera]|uniref:protein RGF1 INDUCIBLE TRANSCRIPTION FACTOR 1-like n=1 Tax=Impatiens glandulifera TaxID=253017 RepID=UPI001FB1440E|nr:protein RGF1 INDUCIBLE TRANSCRIPTION FACTOR 1-like [Impatiens glandulifera]
MKLEVNSFTHDNIHQFKSESSSSVPPQWLQVLLNETFFMPCLVHVSQKKNEKNVLCLECCISLCSHCLLLHPSHHLLQVRRYVYQDVLRLGEAQKLVDCSFVQPYIANRAKVLFLKQRPILNRQFRGGGSGNNCITCERTLQDRFFFCSISCKVHEMVKIAQTKVETINQQYDLKWEKIFIRSCLDSDEKRRITTPNSVLEMPIPLLTSYGRNYHTTSLSDHCSRRKRVPHRSPLY